MSLKRDRASSSRAAIVAANAASSSFPALAMARTATPGRAGARRARPRNAETGAVQYRAHELCRTRMPFVNAHVIVTRALYAYALPRGARSPPEAGAIARHPRCVRGRGARRENLVTRRCASRARRRTERFVSTTRVLKRRAFDSGIGVEAFTRRHAPPHFLRLWSSARSLTRHATPTRPSRSYHAGTEHHSACGRWSPGTRPVGSVGLVQVSWRGGGSRGRPQGAERGGTGWGEVPP